MPTTQTYPIQPFTPAGAQQIASITGQQPAPISASQLNAPQVQLPQPAPVVAAPAPPPPPSIDEIFNTPPSDTQTKVEGLANDIGNLGDQAAQAASFRGDQETANDIAGKKQTVTDLTNRFNTLKAAADQIPLQIQNAYQGRGATAAGVAPIQTAQLRENTIQQLGVSAMLQAANGNLSTAQDLVDSAVKAKFDPITAELQAKKDQLTALTPLLSAEEQKTAAKQTAQLADREKEIAQQQTDQKTIYDTMLKAAQNGADATTLRNIQNATTPQDAITAAGQFNQDPIAKAKALLDLQQTQANIKLTDANIEKALADAQKARSGGTTSGSIAGLTPEALDQQAQNYLITGKLTTLGNGGAAAKLAILNRAAELATGPGGVPGAAARYAAAANAVKTRTDSLTKLLSSSSNLEAQFQRLGQLADKVNTGNFPALNSITAYGKRAVGNDDAAAYLELINTVRSDYANMQAAVAGSKGAEYFSRTADHAIPDGLTSSQYNAIFQTLKTSSDNAQQAIQGEINTVLDLATATPAATDTPQPDSTIEQNGMTFKVNSDGTATRIK